MSYRNSSTIHVPMEFCMPSSNDPNRAAPTPYMAPYAATSVPFSPSTLAINSGTIISPYALGQALQSASPEAVLKLAAQLPTISPDIPPLWNDDLEPLRSVYIDGVPPETTNAEILQLIGAGALERMRRFVRKRCVILIFLRHEAALRFYAEFFMSAYKLRGQPLNIGWVPTPPMAPEIRCAVESQNASRNVYIEQHSGEFASTSERESDLHDELSKFGTIESVFSLAHRCITFVYYTNISSAVCAVETLRKHSEAGDSKWKHYTIAFGKDPCQSLLKLKKQAALLYLGRSPYDTTVLTDYDQATVNQAIAYQSMAAMLTAAISGGDANIGNRCIYIGNCPKDTKLVDICNTVRGGMIENIRFFSDRGICFVTFLEPCAAAQFYATYRLHRLLINGRPVKVAWGKHSGPLLPEIERAISKGVTRNVCIKDARPKHQIHEPLATEAEILKKFDAFGPIEQIKMSPELGCIFITFTSIFKTMQAAEWAKTNKVIANSHIQYGKDRCATFPRFLSNRGFFGSSCGSDKRGHDTFRDPVLLQYLRRELAQQLPLFASQQVHPFAFIAPTASPAPMYYPGMSVFGTQSPAATIPPEQKEAKTTGTETSIPKSREDIAPLKEVEDTNSKLSTQ